MTKAIAQTYTYAHQYRALISLGLVGACILAAVIYTVNVYSVVSHTVALQRIQKQATALSASVSDLNARYLELGDAVSPDALSQYGLAQGSISAYIPRTASTAVIVARGHEL